MLDPRDRDGAVVGCRVALSTSFVGIVFLGERKGASSRPRVEYRW